LNGTILKILEDTQKVWMVEKKSKEAHILAQSNLKKGLN